MIQARDVKWQLTRTLPPFLLDPVRGALRRVRGLPQEKRYRRVRRAEYPAAAGEAVVREARGHLEGTHAVETDSPKLPRASDRWSYFIANIRADIGALKTPRQVFDYGWLKVAFEARGEAIEQVGFFWLYESTLKAEFPHFSRAIDRMGDSPYAPASSLAGDGDRVLSNYFYFQIRFVLLCLTYLDSPRVVCEIGGGTGSPARYWMTNPIHRPDTYIIIDFPESLFFSEVFLKVNLEGQKVHYVTGPEPIPPDVAAEYSVILCPVQFTEARARIAIDLVVNTGSLQEMTDAWVDHWMDWLDRQDCRFFYSLNYFAQPLGHMAEGANFWSFRMGERWASRLLRANPALVKQFTHRQFAEVLAEKLPAALRADLEDLRGEYGRLKRRYLDEQTLLEAMDVVRQCHDEELMMDLLRRCVSELPTVPQEALYLADYLDGHGTDAFRARHGDELDATRSRLRAIHAQGVGDTVPGKFGVPRVDMLETQAE